MTSSVAPNPLKPWAAFAVCVASAGLTILDLSKVNVGLLAIEAALGANPTQLQLVVSGYALAFGISLVPSGRLGDMGSRKHMLLLGVALFTLASLLGAMVSTATALLVGRVLQGIGAGMLMPQVVGLIQQLFQGAERGRAFGIFGGIIGVASAFGPTLGGLLIAAGGAVDGWRWLFWINVPMGIVITYFAQRLLPATSAGQTASRSLDPVGILLIALSTISLLIPFATTTGRTSDNPARWLWMMPFAISLIAFILWERHYERRGMTPVVRLELLGVKSYRHGLIVVSAWFAGMPSLILLTTLFLQQGLHLSAVYAGMASIPFSLVSAFTAWYAGRHIERNGRAMIVGGLAISLLGILAVVGATVFLPLSGVAWGIVAALTLVGIGAGFVMSPNQTLALSEVPVAHGGVAGSVVQLGQRVGMAIGVALSSAIFFSALSKGSAGISLLGAYATALNLGMLVVTGFVVVALITAIVDWHAHRRNEPPQDITL
ncbi:MFS transporter [Cupriavidus pauculus]|uniref:MFS transporter n=1 Tax=Cupriavidus pauculus TaxID=82633 RepID=UPI0030FCBF5D